MLTESMLSTPHQILGAVIVAAVLVVLVWFFGGLDD